MTNTRLVLKDALSSFISLFDQYFGRLPISMLRSILRTDRNLIDWLFTIGLFINCLSMNKCHFNFFPSFSDFNHTMNSAFWLKNSGKWKWKLVDQFVMTWNFFVTIMLGWMWYSTTVLDVLLSEDFTLSQAQGSSKYTYIMWILTT